MKGKSSRGGVGKGPPKGKGLASKKVGRSTGIRKGKEGGQNGVKEKGD